MNLETGLRDIIWTQFARVALHHEEEAISHTVAGDAMYWEP